MSSEVLPFEIKKTLHELSEVLPSKEARSVFLKNAGKQIGDLAIELITEHKRTLVYGAIGLILGHALAKLAGGVPIVGFLLEPLVEQSSILISLAGAGYGFMKDCDVKRVERIIRDSYLKAQTITA